MVVVHVVYDLRHPKAVDEQDQQSREALHLVDDHYPGQKAACIYTHTHTHTSQLSSRRMKFQNIYICKYEYMRP